MFWVVVLCVGEMKIVFSRPSFLDNNETVIWQFLTTCRQTDWGLIHRMVGHHRETLKACTREHVPWLRFQTMTLLLWEQDDVFRQLDQDSFDHDGWLQDHKHEPSQVVDPSVGFEFTHELVTAGVTSSSLHLWIRNKIHGCSWKSPTVDSALMELSVFLQSLLVLQVRWPRTQGPVTWIGDC